MEKSRPSSIYDFLNIYHISINQYHCIIITLSKLQWHLNPPSVWLYLHEACSWQLSIRLQPITVFICWSDVILFLSIIQIIHMKLLLCIKNSMNIKYYDRIISNISIRYDIVIDDTDLSLQFCTSVSVTRITRQTLTDVFLLIANPCWFTFCILITVSLYITARFFKTFNVRMRTINYLLYEFNHIPCFKNGKRIFRSRNYLIYKIPLPCLRIGSILQE